MVDQRMACLATHFPTSPPGEEGWEPALSACPGCENPIWSPGFHRACGSRKTQCRSTVIGSRNRGRDARTDRRRLSGSSSTAADGDTVTFTGPRSSSGSFGSRAAPTALRVGCEDVNAGMGWRWVYQVRSAVRCPTEGIALRTAG